MKKWIWLPVFTLLSSCSYMPDWMGAEPEDRLSGERFSVLPDREVLAADPTIQNDVIRLPVPQDNGAWYQGQAIAENGISIVRHVSLRGDLQKSETYSDARAPDEDVRLTSTPIIVGKLLVLLDGQGRISALSLDDPDTRIWQVNLQELAVEGASASGREGSLLSWFDSSDNFIGGNIAFVEGRIVATTGNGHVFAFDIESGTLLWHRTMGISIQSAPSGKDGSVYFVTSDNQLYALSLKDGITQWTHNGVPQQTKIFGAPAPVPFADLVIVPYSSGQLLALRRVNGFKLWEANLDSSRQAGARGFQFTDILAAPVAYGGRVFASAEDHLVAIDGMTGNRLWDVPVTLSGTPWMAGEWLFGITNKEELVAVNAVGGKIRWVTPLPQYADPESKEERIRWSGPVLANGQLIVAGSNGELKTFVVDSGTLHNTIAVSDEILLPPVAAGGKLFLLNNSADLSVLE